VAVQDSPAIHFLGHVWNTTPTAADNFVDWQQYVVPTSAASPTSKMSFRSSLSTTSTPSYTERMSVDSAGNVTATTFTGALSGNATTATALAANGANCTGNNFALGVDASGVAECAQPAFSNLSGSVAASQMPALTGAVTSSAGSTTTSAGKADLLDASFFCSDAGASDAYACSLSPAITAYVTGTHYRFKANTANTGAASINLNSLGAKTVVKVQGAITTALVDNDILAGQWVEVVYDGTNMQMMSPLGNAPSGTISGLTTSAIVTAASATSIQTPSATTTLDSSGNLSTPGSISSTGSNGGIDATEGTGAGLTAAASHDLLWGDSTAHRWKMNNNNGTSTTVAGFSDDLSVFASTTSAQFLGVISDEVGSGTKVAKFDSVSGNSGVAAQTSGTLTSGNCAKFDANGNIVDNGATCGAGGGGSGTVTSSTPGTIAQYSASTTVMGDTRAKISPSQAQNIKNSTSLRQPGGWVAYHGWLSGRTPLGTNLDTNDCLVYYDAQAGLMKGITPSFVACDGPHALLSASHTDTTAASAVRGDIIAAIGSTPTWQRVAHSSATGGYFKWNGTDVVASTGAASGTGTCTNQFVRAANADAAPTCNTVSLTADVTGTLPTGNGGTGNTTGVQTYVFFATTTAPACTTGGGTTTFLGPSGAGSTTETSVVRYVVPLAGTVKNLRVWLGGNVPASETAAIKVVLGGSAQANPTCSIAAGAATCSDTSGTLSVVAGDTLNAQVNCSGGTTALNARASVSFTIQE
jgi:hypothetical protein